MTRTTVAVIGARYPDLAIERAILGPDVDLVTDDGGDQDRLLSVAAGAEVVLAGSQPRFDRAVLGGLRGRGIVRYGTGVDSIDLDAAREHGLWVARVSDYGTEAVAFHAVTMVTAGARQLLAAHATVREGGWGFAELRPLHLPSASTAGVVGYGRIGRYAARLLRGLGYRVLVHDPFATEADPDHELVPELHQLLAAADVVTLHAPGDPDGRPLLGPDELAACREGSVVVNTARGTLIDLHALVDGLLAGRPRLAALDVFATEPVDVEVFAPVRDRVLLTPHMAWYSEESERDLRRKAAEQARLLLDGRPPTDVVVDPTRDRWVDPTRDRWVDPTRDRWVDPTGDEERT